MARLTRPRLVGVAGLAAALAVLSSAGAEQGAAPAALRRDVGLTLVGVVVKDSSEESVAIIEDRATRKQGFYRMGAVVKGGRISGMLPDRVVLTFPDGELQLRLSVTGAAGGAVPVGSPPSPSPVAMSPAAMPPAPVTPEPTDPRESAMFRRVEPALFQQLSGADVGSDVTPLGPHGVRIGEVSPSGLFAALGLKKGDIVRRVNGAIPGAGASLSQVIAGGGGDQMMRMEIERNGSVDIVYYRIEP